MTTLIVVTWLALMALAFGPGLIHGSRREKQR